MPTSEAGRRLADGNGEFIKQFVRKYLFGPEFDSARSVHEEMQWYPRSQIRQIQWDALLSLLRDVHATNDFYRPRLDGVLLNETLTPEQFTQVPRLTRAEVVSSWDLIRHREKRGRFMQRWSGGSSGISVSVPLDVPTYCWYMATLWRGFRWWEVDLTDRGVILLGPLRHGVRRSVVRVKDWAMNWLRISVDNQFDRHANDILDEIASFRPSFLYGFPSAIHPLAVAIRAKGDTAGTYSPKLIVLTGEPVYPFQRRNISEAFQCPVAEEYGSGELGCIAFQCPHGSLHITVENLFIETVPTAPIAGEAGLVVATHLRNRRFPLIRYESGDLGTVEEKPCACGRELPSLKIIGRTKDKLMGRDGAQLARPIVDRLLDSFPAALQGSVRIVHGTPGSVVLQVQRTHARQTLMKEAVAAAETLLGSGWHLSTVEVERLPRLPSGKLLYFQRSQGHV